MTAEPNYTPAVMRIAQGVRKLTTAELLALRETLRGDFDMPPDIGVREPRTPHDPRPSEQAEADRPA